jgi:tetratricopeptide (TPR) repeat protein
MPHLSLDLATMVLEGELPPRVLVRVLYEHIKELCPECREALETVQGMPVHRHRAPAASPPEGPHHYHAAISQVGRHLGERLRSVEQERRRARRDCTELLALPAAERPRRVAAARTRFRSRALAERLVEASRETVRRDPAEAAAIAELVPLVLARLTAAEAAGAASLDVLARAHRANALRVSGDLRAADGAFRQLRERLAAEALDEPTLHAEVCSLEASLRFDLGRFDETEELLDRAVLLARLSHDDRAAAKALIQRANLHDERDDLPAAVDDLREALALIDEESDRHLAACAIGTLARVECERGAHAAAAELVTRHRALLAGAGGPWESVRLLTLEGRIAHGHGRLAEAEERLVAAHRLCIEEGLDLRTAVAALELAVLYAEQGRVGEVRRLAQQVQPIFQSHEVGREATAALVLFQQAVAAERITVEAMRSVRDVVSRRARGGSGARADELPS